MRTCTLITLQKRKDLSRTASDAHACSGPQQAKIDTILYKGSLTESACCLINALQNDMLNNCQQCLLFGKSLQAMKQNQLKPATVASRFVSAAA